MKENDSSDKNYFWSVYGCNKTFVEHIVSLSPTPSTSTLCIFAYLCICDGRLDVRFYT